MFSKVDFVSNLRIDYSNFGRGSRNFSERTAQLIPIHIHIPALEPLFQSSSETLLVATLGFALEPILEYLLGDLSEILQTSALLVLMVRTLKSN
jgi:hypothetical protein